MSQEAHVSELLPAYALGCLDQVEALLVAEHLASCSECCAELASLQDVVDQLAFAVPYATPPKRLKERLSERIQPTAAEARQSRPSWRAQLAGFWKRAAPAWGVVSLVLILALAVNNLVLRQEISTPSAEPTGLRVVSLRGTDLAPDASGTLIISADGEYGTLVVDHLPALDLEHQYQLWLIRDEERADGGVFSVNNEGYGSLSISSPDPLISFPTFGVTIEPSGGSLGPTGEKVLGGSL